MRIDLKIDYWEARAALRFPRTRGDGPDRDGTLTVVTLHRKRFER